jgi:O-antigen ligase
MLKANPLFGVGFGRYTEFHERVAHNSFVHVFGELGVLGALFFVALFYWFFRGIATLSVFERAHTSTVNWLSRSFVASGVALIAGAWFLSRQYNYIPFILMALGACHISTAGVTVGQHRERVSARDLQAIAVLTVSGIAVTYVLVRALAIWSGRV